MTFSALIATAIVINELMASNVGTVMSPATNFDSWIELYNPSDQDVDLGGWYLSDNAENLRMWHMPKDMGKIPAKGYKVVWLGSNNLKTNQAPFKLDCEGGTVFLSDGSGQLVASQQYPEAMSLASYARTADGGDEWGWTADATPGETNSTSVFADKRLAPPVVNQDSKLFSNTLSLKVDIPEGSTLVYTTDGSLPILPQGGGQGKEWTDFIKNGNCEGDDVTCLVGKDGDGGGEFETHIMEGVGYNGSRGIVVHSVKNPAYEWDTQFFVYTPDHVWTAGEHYRFKMKVRADRDAQVSVQSHTTPGSYIWWMMLEGNYNITTKWQEIVYEGEVDNSQVGSAGGLQTIAFNLNVLRGVENNYYFDDISWESHNGGKVQSGKISEDGKFTINNTTNFRFRLYQDGWLPSAPVTRSYIKTNNKYTIPVVSIVGDRKYFTDPQWGIDTKGTNGRTGNGQETKCNWNMDWERPVNFSFITPEGVMAYNQDVEISVSGGWTRAANPRSFKLKAGKEFDGKNSLDYMFFPQKPYLRNKVLLLRNGGNDVWENNGSRFMDPALQTIIQRSGFNLDVQSYVPVMEYVNGEFRGVLNMREPNNKKFVESNFGYDDELIDMFEMSADSNVVFMQGTSAVLDRIYELGEKAPDPAAYEELKQLLDLDEYINYMAVELFLGSSDWPHNNIKGFRRQPDGRYRFVTFDLDFAFKNSNPFTAFADDQWHTFNYIYDLNESRYEEIKLVTFFLNMLRNDEFRKKFIDTYCLVGGSVFEIIRSTEIIEELADFVRPMAQLDGWRSPDASANLIRTKLRTLNEDMMSCMQNFKQMKLSNVTKQKVTLRTDTQGAKLFVNGMEVPYAYFNGRLFAPVELEAKAPAGYVFTGWKDNYSSNSAGFLSTEPVISLPKGNSVSITACFTPMEDSEKATNGIRPVRVNEVSGANNIFANEYWKRNDWVELYNTTSQPVDVEGMYLSDNTENPMKYQITKGENDIPTIIPPFGHLVVWCDKLTPVSQLHASFKLDADGGDVMLTAADGSWSDVMSYPSHNEYETVGRYPDGTNDVFLMDVPTIAKTNLRTSYAVSFGQNGQDDIAAVKTNAGLTANYALGGIIVRTGADVKVMVEVYSMAGQTVMKSEANTLGGYADIRLPHLKEGCYVARVADAHGKTVTCKFVYQ